MGKYDFPLYIHENDALSMLIQCIPPNSTVLEFGCAAGRMTKYMKEVLNCKVYIVEYDQPAYEQACEFAVDGLCDDIMNFSWLDKFSHIKFDAIILADVLEHLYDPTTVLKKTSALLAENGHVLASIPNICHNDIIWKIYNNRFEYTPIGLLDDTHIRFFSEHTLGQFAKKAGYKIVKLNYTFLGTGASEQFENSQLPMNQLLTNMLLYRKNGSIYQFILDMVPENNFPEIPEKTSCDPIYSQVAGILYYNNGSGYSSQKAKIIIGQVCPDQTIHFHIVEHLERNIVSIRFDPCEEQSCIIVDCRANSGININNIKIGQNIKLSN